MDDLHVYLETLFEGLDGLVYSPVKTATKFEADHWFEWPKQKEQLVQHIQSAVGDVYISPAVYSAPKATKEYVKKVQTTWIEFDGQEEKIDFRNLPVPTLIVQTSFENHSHAYWRLDPTHQTSIEDLNRRLTYYLGADISGWDVTQLLRPPGTFNHKRQLPVVLSHHDSTSFSYEQFEFVPAIAAPPAATVSVSELLPVGTILSDHHISWKLVKMIKKETPVEPHRSSFLARLANELAEEDFSHLEIVSCLKEADERIKKYSGRSDQLIRLSQIADYALHKHVAEETAIIWTPEKILKHVDDIQWIWPGLLHTTGQLVISSAPGVGKTQWCAQAAYCLTVGERFLGYLAPSKHRVGFLSLEMDVAALKYIFSHHKNEWAELPQFAIIDESSSLTNYENFVAENELSVLFVDSLSELFDDTEDNPQREAKRVMRWCRKIRRRYGTAIVLIHHNRKATEGNKKPKGLSDLVGSFQFGKDSDTVLQLWKDHKGIELSAVKARFGPEIAFNVERNSNLWFVRKDASNRTEPTSTNRERTEGHEDPGSGHGNSENRTTTFEASFRLGTPDFGQ